MWKYTRSLTLRIHIYLGNREKGWMNSILLFGSGRHAVCLFTRLFARTCYFSAVEESILSNAKLNYDTYFIANDVIFVPHCNIQSGIQPQRGYLSSVFSVRNMKRPAVFSLKWSLDMTILSTLGSQCEGYAHLGVGTQSCLDFEMYSCA